MRRKIAADTEITLLHEELRASSTYIHFLIADLRTYLARKAYNPDQPRDDHGRWTSSGGGDEEDATGNRPGQVRVADDSSYLSEIGPLSTDDYGRRLSDLARPPAYAYGSTYSPDLPGWHDYTAGPNVVCSAAQNCSRDEIVNQLSRFAVPGQDPSEPVTDKSTNWVFLPGTILPAGQVQTTVLNNGLTIRNQTFIDHVLYDGVAERTATQNADGSWSVTTHGYGNNLVPGMVIINQEFGPSIFDTVDSQMRDNIARHHGSQKSAARLIHIARSGLGTYPGLPIRTRPLTGGIHHDIP